MSRNRMKNSQSLHWMGVVKWVMIAGLMAGLGLCYMLCKNQNLHLADEDLKLQRQLNMIEQRNAELAIDLEGMKSMSVLQKRLKAMHSSLVYWNDPHATWVRLDQNTRATIARMGTSPRSNFNNIEATPVASTTLQRQQ